MRGALALVENIAATLRWPSPTKKLSLENALTAATFSRYAAFLEKGRLSTHRKIFRNLFIGYGLESGGELTDALCPI